MSRVQQVLEVMQAQPERGWTSTEMSVALRCAPAQARGALLRHVATGQAVVDDAGTFRLPDAPPPAPAPVEQVYALLTPTRELTPFGVADLYPELGMSEDEVIDHLAALARARRIDLWASLPGQENPADPALKELLARRAEEPHE